MAAEPTKGLTLSDIFNARSSRRRLFHHVTPARHLPDIIASGALLPAAERTESHMHDWGKNGDIGRDLVCLAMKPHWGMVNAFAGEEAVIVSFEPLDILELADVRPCPTNSGAAQARPFLTKRVPAEAALGLCLEPNAWRAAEILVAGPVPLTTVRVITFCDQTCRDRWRAALIETSRNHSCVWHPKAVVRVSDPDTPPRFPDDLEINMRTTVRLGVDVRTSAVPVIEPVEDFELSAIDWLDQDDPKLEAESHEDLYEELYGERAIERSVGDFYPDDPELDPLGPG